MLGGGDMKHVASYLSSFSCMIVLESFVHSNFSVEYKKW